MSTKLKEVVDKINSLGYVCVDDVLNSIIQQKALVTGLILVTLGEEGIRHVSIYDSRNRDFDEYKVLAAKKLEGVWNITIASEEQRRKALQIIADKEE